MTEDVVTRLARYRPDAHTLAREWPQTARERILNAALAADDGVVRFVATRPQRRRRLAPVAASAAVLAGVGAMAVVAGAGGRGSGGSGGTPALDDGATSYASSTLSDRPDVGAGQFAYVVSRDGDTVIRSWADENGDQTYLRNGGCENFPTQQPGFETPSAAFFASLPTNPAALSATMRRKVSGSSSQDEALFVAVGDSLRMTSGLASPRLRAAMVDVIASLPETTVQTGVLDAEGRSSIRVDFTDQSRRPGELDSLYFDPTDFRLLEERSGSNGEPSTDPSTRPYGATPTNVRSTPRELTGKAYVFLVTRSRTVDAADGPPPCGGRGGNPSAGLPSTSSSAETASVSTPPGVATSATSAAR